jgi:hypothetical protein
MGLNLFRRPLARLSLPGTGFWYPVCYFSKSLTLPSDELRHTEALQKHQRSKGHSCCKPCGNFFASSKASKDHDRSFHNFRCPNCNIGGGPTVGQYYIDASIIIVYYRIIMNPKNTATAQWVINSSVALYRYGSLRQINFFFPEFMDILDQKN